MDLCAIFVHSDVLGVTVTVSGLGMVTTDLEGSVSGSKSVMVVGDV